MITANKDQFKPFLTYKGSSRKKIIKYFPVLSYRATLINTERKCYPKIVTFPVFFMNIRRLLASSSRTSHTARHKRGCWKTDPCTQWPLAGTREPTWDLKELRCPATPLTIWLPITHPIISIWTFRASCPAQFPPLSYLNKSSAPCTVKWLMDGTSATPQQPTNTKVTFLFNLIYSLGFYD